MTLTQILCAALLSNELHNLHKKMSQEASKVIAKKRVSVKKDVDFKIPNDERLTVGGF